MPEEQKEYHPWDDESHRLSGYNYRDPGWYYITICTEWHKWYFGNVVDDQMHLNQAGSIVQTVWYALPQRFPGVSVDEFVIMPNHIHGIVVLPEHYPREAWANKKRWHRPSVGTILRAFKGAATYQIHRTTANDKFEWQPNYYDHIVRNDPDLDRIRLYIINNPAQWAEDEYNNSISKGKNGHNNLSL
jgi:putative transposase